MENRECHFAGQDPQEEVKAFFLLHWIVIFRDIIFFILIFGLYFLLSFYLAPFLYFTEPLVFHLIITLLMIFFTHYTFLKIIKYFENVIIITNARLVELKEEDIDFLNIREVPDIQKEQEGFLKVLLNFGTLKFAEMKSINNVSNPAYYYNLVCKIKLNLIPPLNTPPPGQPPPVIVEGNLSTVVNQSSLERDQINKTAIPQWNEDNIKEENK